MVLRKVGEFQTTINVNGNQKVSTTQSSDKTYNLSESFTTDIQVNGSTQQSFSQTSDSTYNVNTSLGSYGSLQTVAQHQLGGDSSQTYTAQNGGPHKISWTNSGAEFNAGDYEVEINGLSYKQGEGSVIIELSAGDTVTSNSYDYSGTTTIQRPPTDTYESFTGVGGRTSFYPSINASVNEL